MLASKWCQGKLSVDIANTLDFVQNLPLQRNFILSEALLSEKEIEAIVAHILKREKEIEAEFSIDDVNEFVCDVVAEKVGVINEKLYWQNNLQVAPTPTVTNKQMLDMAFGRAHEMLAEHGVKPIITNDMQWLWPQLADYFTNTQGALDLNKGLLFCGSVGTGKTLTMKCFAENPRQSYVITPCDDVARAFGEIGDSYIEKYSKLRRIIMPDRFKLNSAGTCFDELGAEIIGSNFGKRNVIQQLIGAINRNKSVSKHTHYTSNLNPPEIVEQYGQRVFDRLKEDCNIVLFSGTQSLRK